jgi:hypothetical protein
MKAQIPRRSLTPLLESPMPIYMTGVAIGMGCGFLAILILLGVLTA